MTSKEIDKIESFLKFKILSEVHDAISEQLYFDFFPNYLLRKNVFNNSISPTTRKELALETIQILKRIFKQPDSALKNAIIDTACNKESEYLDNIIPQLTSTNKQLLKNKLIDIIRTLPKDYITASGQKKFPDLEYCAVEAIKKILISNPSLNQIIGTQNIENKDPTFFEYARNTHYKIAKRDSPLPVKPLYVLINSTNLELEHNPELVFSDEFSSKTIQENSPVEQSTT
jgi:hypothetical protein